MSDASNVAMLKEHLARIRDHEIGTAVVETAVLLPSRTHPVGLFRVTQNVAVVVFGRTGIDLFEGWYSQHPDKAQDWAQSRADVMSLLDDGSARFCFLAPGEMKRLVTLVDD